MLHYIIVFFILTVVSAYLGFGSLAGTFSQVAKLLTVIFVVLLIISLIKHIF